MKKRVKETRMTIETTFKGAVALCAALAAVAVTVPPAQAADVMKDPPPAGYYTFQKVVYQNDGGQPTNAAYFAQLMRHLSAHLAATDGKVEIRVVSFAAGVTLFQLAKTDPDLAASLDALRAKGVRFMVCRNTMNGMKLRPEDLYKVKDEDVVPSGVAEIARLQGLGYVYVHP
jgi:intracellular sulfur oxidation DsrE/DsrF family protein